ncbi:MAG: DoxX family protein [Hyphomicrobiales bacterium]|nr:DoxX family protein [Hyphomicrobiales bacterium]
MAAIAAQTPSPARSLGGLVRRLDGLLARAPTSLASLALRVTLALPFFRSGLTKWDGPFQLSGGARYLFTEEFRLHILGGEYPYPAPELMAFASGTAEIVLPILLVLGLGTRFAAFGLLVMTAIIQLTVPDGWEAYHLPWAATALAILVIGPGRIALDAALGLGRAQPSAGAAAAQT